MSDKTKKIVELLKKALALLGGDAEESTEKPNVPDLKAIKAMDPEALAEAASALGFKTKKPKSVLTTVAKIIAEDGVDGVTEDDIEIVLTAAGLESEDDAEADAKQILEFVGAVGDDSTDDESDDASEDESEDSSEDEEDDAEDEKPAKGKKGKSASDDDDDESDDDESEEEEEEKPAKGKKSKKDDDDEGEDEESEDEESEDEGVDPDSITEHLEEYNDAAPKKLKCKSGKELLARCKDSDGKLVEWGTPYLQGNSALCCGLPLETVGDETDNTGKCLVTGKVFKFDEDDNSFSEVKPTKKKK